MDHHSHHKTGPKEESRAEINICGTPADALCSTALIMECGKYGEKEEATGPGAGTAACFPRNPGSVQLRFRLRLVPVRPRRDVLELRLEEVVQELLLRVLHPREDLARGRRADSIDGVRVHGALPVNGYEVRDLLGAGEEFPFFVCEIQLPRPLRVGVSYGPRGPAEYGQKAGLAVHAFRMVRHLADSDLLMEVPAFETQEMNGLRRQVQTHPVQDLLPLRFRGEELRRLHIPPQNRIREGRWRLLGAMDDDLDLARTNLLHDLPHAREVRVEQERLPHRLVDN